MRWLNPVSAAMGCQQTKAVDPATKQAPQSAPAPSDVDSNSSPRRKNKQRQQEKKKSAACGKLPRSNKLPRLDSSNKSTEPARICAVPTCNAPVDEDNPGSCYCAVHEFEPVGQASFDEVQRILAEFRDAMAFEGWNHCFFDCKRGWNRLGNFSSMEEMGSTLNGVEVSDGRLLWIDLRCCNLCGTIPPSIARLDTLKELWLGGNQITGYLPRNFGSASCLPSLRKLQVHDAMGSMDDGDDYEEAKEIKGGRKLVRGGSFVC